MKVQNTGHSLNIFLRNDYIEIKKDAWDYYEYLNGTYRIYFNDMIIAEYSGNVNHIDMD